MNKKLKNINTKIKKIVPKRVLDHYNNGDEQTQIIYKWLFRILGLGISGILLATIGLFVIIFLYGQNLPDYTTLQKYEPPVSSRVYASDGNIMTQYLRERRVFMPIDNIPDKIQQAFITTEDQDFYSHRGVDTFAIVRAIFQNVKNYIQGRRSIGASTITQQVARQFFLTNERTLTRKIKEAILAIRIERVLTKKRILELYLNQIYLGRGAYGVAAASMRYFNLPPAKLNYAQAAYLAALPKAPNNYHPVRKKKKAIARRNWVLSRMYDEGYIDSDELEKSQSQPLNAMLGRNIKTVESDYFLEETRRTIFKDYGDKGLYEGGLSIHTTLRSDIQKVAHKALRKGLMAYDKRHGYRGAIVNLGEYEADEQIKRFKKIPPMAGTLGWKQALVQTVNHKTADILFKNGKKLSLPFSAVSWARKYYKKRPGSLPNNMGDVLKVGDVILLEQQKNKYELRQVPLINGAMVVMDPHTGRILAMVGGWDFKTSKFNRATQAKRQPGSSVKPFVYLTALNNGFTPATMILDAPFVLTLESGEKWKPQNFSKKFYGNQLMRVGIEKSRNLMTVRLAQDVGMDKFGETLKSFNIMAKPEPYLAYALGSGETTLLKMVTAYSMVVNGGKEIKPSLIDRIQNRYGKVIFKHNEKICDGCNVLSEEMPQVQDTRKQITDPIAAYQLVTMLRGVVERGTGKQLRDLKIPMGGKTGTTNDNKDAWFIAVTPDLVVGTYLGFDNPRWLGKQPPDKKYNWWRQETGGSVAVPTIKEFFLQLKDTMPKIPFRTPEGVRFVHIDKRTGKKAEKQSKHTQLEAFKVGTEPKSNSSSDDDNTQESIGLTDVY
ncbi:MAG: penicillin-binding protein 1A [Alphaproteobacteria bacterium]